MKKALDLVQRAAEYREWFTKRRAKRTETALKKDYLRRTRRERTLLKRGQVFEEVKKLLLEKRKLVFKLIRREELTEAEKRRLPILFKPNELEKYTKRKKTIEELINSDKKMSDIIQRTQNGIITKTDLDFAFAYFGGLKPARQYVNYLKIFYNDRMDAQKTPKLKFEEDKSMKALRRKLAEQ